jgi:ubiquitin-activating enzyme E1
LKGPKTIQQLLDWYEEEHEIEVSMISSGTSLLWASFAKSAAARRKMLIEAVCAEVRHVDAIADSSLLLEVLGDRIEDDEEALLPHLIYKIK